jgi:hypothetical protein
MVKFLSFFFYWKRLVIYFGFMRTSVAYGILFKWKKKDTSGWKWVPNNHINFRFKRTSWRNVSLRKHRDEMCHWENIVTKCVTEKTSWRNVSLREHRDEMFLWENIVTKCVTEKTSWRNVSLRKHRDEMCRWENIVTKCVTEKTSWRNVSLRKHRDEMCHWERHLNSFWTLIVMSLSEVLWIMILLTFQIV